MEKKNNEKMLDIGDKSFVFESKSNLKKTKKI